MSWYDPKSRVCFILVALALMINGVPCFSQHDANARTTAEKFTCKTDGKSAITADGPILWGKEHSLYIAPIEWYRGGYGRIGDRVEVSADLQTFQDALGKQLYRTTKLGHIVSETYDNHGGARVLKGADRLLLDSARAQKLSRTGWFRRGSIQSANVVLHLRDVPRPDNLSFSAYVKAYDHLRGDREHETCSISLTEVSRFLARTSPQCTSVHWEQYCRSARSTGFLFRFSIRP